MRNAGYVLFLLFSAISAYAQQVNIIPQPVSLQTRAGKFILSNKTTLAAKDAEDRKIADLFNEYLKQVYGCKLDVDNQASKNYIHLSTKKFIRAPDKDAYTLKVTANGISIEGDTYAGTFYGMQTLIQLLPVENEKAKNVNWSIPFVTIQDYPRFSYRGMHLDVARHFFPVDFVKKYIDYLALHKMNYFHWHLTDDQGWRIEIKKYPKLTQIGGWRNGTIIGRYPGTGNDNTPYGGFYTQDEIRDVVKYAADRYITVIPEIEMPGHSSAAIAAYPWLSCFPDEETVIPTHPSQASVQQQASGRKKLVQETWGVFDDIFCAGKDSTFAFLQDVMDEVLALFPSKYIHVGGDEAPKTNWKRCAGCQARMKELGLKDEHELQSYFIQRMENYLNSKGRTLIGWDEILEGGLAPNAWVMSWRGEQGGIDAATQDHNVIMTPGEYVYLDHSQTKNEDSVTIGGYIPVEKVYAYEPVPKELDASKANYVQGAQGNVWTEYIAYPGKVEYMIFPRMSALSEVLWSPKEKRDWSDFEKLLQTQFRRYDLWKANYSKAYFDLNATIIPAPGFNGVLWKVETKSTTPIAINFNNVDTVWIYSKPQLITNSARFYAYTDNGLKIDQQFNFNKATGKKISITTSPTEKYPGQGGAFGLVNGVYSNKGLSYPDWLGWIGDDLEATIDLGQTTSFDSVRMHTVDQNGSWIYLPQYVEVFTSNDGKNFTSVGKSSVFVKDTLTMGWITVSTPRQSSGFIKLVAKNYGMIPDGKAGAGNKAWLFADEIQVY
jgi:hexosaminidase